MKAILFFIIILLTFDNIYSANYYVNDNSTLGDWYCSGPGNNVTGDGSISKPFATFNKLWNSRNGTFSNGDIIFIDAGTYTSYSGGDGFGLNCGYTIQVKLTIQGAGNNRTIFDNNYITSSSVANGGGAVTSGSFSYFAQFTGGSAGAKINDIQFKNYKYNTTFAGQCISINGVSSSTQEIEFNNVVFSGCQNNQSGYAAPVYFYAAGNVINKLKINGGGFYCNGTEYLSTPSNYNNGGGIDVVGNVALSSYPTIKLTISNVVFSGVIKSMNPQYHGGAISFNGDFTSDSLIINNSLFENNKIDYSSSSSCGSAIHHNSNLGTHITSINNSIFRSNSITGSSSTSNGATCYFAKGAISINSSLFENNTTTVGTGSVKGNVAVNTGNLSIIDSKFSGNDANNAKDIYLIANVGSIAISNTSLASSGTSLENKSTGSFTIVNSGNPTTSGSITKTNTTNPASFTNPIVPTYTGDCTARNIATLPAMFTHLSIKNFNKKALLNWQTSSEKNTDEFVIERSVNGVDFEKIAAIKASGNSQQIINYEFTDNQPLSNVSYYRIKLTDFDNSVSYTKILIYYSENKKTLVFPTIITDNHVFLKLNSSVKYNKLEYEATDLLGRIIQKNIIEIVDGKDIYDITLPESLINGTYLIRFNEETHKIIK